MTIVLLCIGLAIILATIIFLFIVHFNRFDKFSDLFQYWLDPRYRLVYDAFVYYKKCQKDAASIEAITDELQFLFQQEVAKKNRECRFDDYTVIHIRQIAEWIHKGRQRSLVLYGPYGVGKTIMLYALERYFCRHYADWRNDTREHFTTSVTGDNLCLLSIESTKADIVSNYKNCDILLMDDVGAEKDKYLCYGTLVTPVADIIDHRYIRRKKTIFTTDCTRSNSATDMAPTGRAYERGLCIHQVLQSPKLQVALWKRSRRPHSISRQT